MLNRESLQLQSQAWEVFNAAHHESKPVAEGMRETGNALLRQSITTQREALYAKLDAQNREIDLALRLKDVRAQIAQEARK